MPRILPLSRALILLAFLALPFASPEAAEAATYTVNAADDVTDGRCDTRHCSLREALDAARASSGADSISFAIPGSPPFVIRLQSGLSILDSDLTIAGDTQPGYAGHPVVVLDGSEATSGIRVVGTRVTLRGLALVHFDGAAVQTGELSVIERNYLGLNADGTAAGNGAGAWVRSEGTIVRDNVISANETGLELVSAIAPVIQRNLIGTTPDGEAALGNGTGILIRDSTHNALIGGSGRWDHDGNVIAGSRLYGIDDTSTPYGGNVIANNLIGTDIHGARALPNAVGIHRFSEHTVYAGGLTIQYNVVSGNGIGMWLGGNGHHVYLNFVGIDRLGARAVPNTEVGIQLEGCGICTVEQNVVSGNPTGILLLPGPGIELDTVIGGNRVGVDPGVGSVFPNGIGIDIEGGDRTTIERNVLGGNDIGLLLNAGAATVRANAIGVGYTGRPPALPNRIGIQIGIGFEPSTIGGSSESDANLVAYNTSDGIRSAGGGRFVLQVNRIYENGGHGVHIDAGRAEPGSDGLGVLLSANSIYDNAGLGIRIEHPELAAGLMPPAITRAGSSEVAGNAAPDSIVEVFLAAPDPSGSGEGKTYVGYGRSGADGAFAVRVTDTGTCPIYTATTTDRNSNTSEFSLNRSTCLRLPPLIGIGILLGLAGGGSAFTVIIRRRPPDLRSAPGILLGAAVGLGLGFLFLALPSVEMDWGPEDQVTTPVPGNLPPLTLTPATEITLTPAPAPEIMARENANCRHGPSTKFNVATHLLQGQVVPVTGRLADGGWWLVQPPDLEAPCWIAESLAQPNGDLEAVPLVIPPAAPTVTPTEEPASGCRCWTGNQCEFLPQCPAQCTPCP